MIQVLDKYGNTYSEIGTLVVLDKFGNIKKLSSSSGGSEKEKRHEWISPYSYCGTAPIGSLTSASVWNIKRIEVFDDGTTDIKSATSVKWDDRLTVTYI